jgi:uncharacterized protein with von Willebrand factor type A (vWA) domain
MNYLFHNLLHFGQVLHALGLDVQAGSMSGVAAALEHIDIGRKPDFYYTLRTLLIHRHQDLETFDEAFRVFWRRPSGEWSRNDLRALGEHRRFGNPQVDFPSGESHGLEGDSSIRTLSEVVERIAPLSYSGRHVSRVKDFAEFTEHEIRQAKAMLAALNWELGMRWTHRWKAGEGRDIDARRLLRRNIKYAGELLELPKRRRQQKRRPLVLLCDISGSMERYSRMLLHFIHSVTGGLDRVEAFLFATHLTRVTRELSRRSPDEAISRIVRRVPDWSGGTRIGEALRTFNVHWCRRVLPRGAVVLLISDGWDRGEPELLRREMNRLQRTCHRLIWLNPLLGAPDYQPLTRGMQAALPFIDDFLPVHNLESLESLAGHLNALPPRRGRTRNRGQYGPSRHLQL